MNNENVLIHSQLLTLWHSDQILTTDTAVVNMPTRILQQWCSGLCIEIGMNTGETPA